VKYRRESEDQALADRLISYSDAIVALAFIVSSGLGLSIADPDTRLTITDVAIGMIIGNAILGVVFSSLLAILRRWELDLRGDVPISEKYRRYSHRIYMARHVVIWLSISQTVAIMSALGH
jgi:hypothetical protein